MNVNSLAHTKWECKYHIVFAPKYRRQVIYKDIKADVGQILGSLCRRKGIEIIEAECCPDHIHMLVRIPPKYSVYLFNLYLVLVQVFNGLVKQGWQALTVSFIGMIG